MPPKPDPAHYTLMHFLDRFVYRSARSKSNATLHGSSIMQPMAGSTAADLLVKPGKDRTTREEINSEAFWQRKVEDVAADEGFFHSYFNQTEGKKRKGAVKKGDKVADKESEGDEQGEDEIWKAIAASKPEVEGDDEDDDLSIGDLESAYSASEDEGEDRVEVGDGDAIEDEFDDDEDMPDLDSEDGALLEDDDDLPEDFENPGEEAEEEEAEMSENKKKRKERKKIKQLPTFASAEDYAKLLGDDDDEDL